jgi:hypothetical protein
VSEKVRDVETDWVERPNSEAQQERRWRMRSRAEEPARRLMDADVVVGMVAYSSEEKAKAYIDGRRYWGFHTRFPELEGFFDEHRAAGPQGLKPPGYWSVSCRVRNILIGIYAPSPEIAIRFAKLVALELPKPEGATE